jgi:AcrR family transcriptional regulator
MKRAGFKLASLALHRKNIYVPRVDDELYRAAVEVLSEVGWDGLTLERVAQRAGRGRVTLWRNGISRDSLLQELLRKLAEDYRDAMLPVLTTGGSPRERLERTMHALCDIVDAHSALLIVSDEVFHWAHELGNVPMKFLDPFIAVIRDARASNQLRARGDDVEVADILFNAVTWTYLHFRVRHEWTSVKARRLLFETLLEGVLE